MRWLVLLAGLALVVCQGPATAPVTQAPPLAGITAIAVSTRTIDIHTLSSSSSPPTVFSSTVPTPTPTPSRTCPPRDWMPQGVWHDGVKKTVKVEVYAIDEAALRVSLDDRAPDEKVVEPTRPPPRITFVFRDVPDGVHRIAVTDGCNEWNQGVEVGLPMPTTVPTPPGVPPPARVPIPDVPGPPSPPTTRPTAVPVGAVPAVVLNIADGDTIRVLIDDATHRVRYIGIDAPEVVDPRQQEKPFAREASEANAELVVRKVVWLEKDISEVDQYGQLLRYVWLEDGTLVNELLVVQGLAKVATFPPDVKYEERLLAAQNRARQLGIGLWSLPGSPGQGSAPAVPIATAALPIRLLLQVNDTHWDNNALALWWEDLTDPRVRVLVVERSTGRDGPWTPVAVVPVGQPPDIPRYARFWDPGLPPKQEFHYRIYGCAEIGRSEYSESASGMVPDFMPGLKPPIVDPVPVLPPC